MKTSTTMSMLCLLITFATFTASSQTIASSKTKNEKSMKNMNTYVIEREIPNASSLTAEELQGISRKSCSVLKELGPEIEWVQSYVTDNKVFCIYRAENEEILRTHAMKGGFPINSVHPLSAMISPATATAALADIK
jgi:hypothetical protein